MKLTCLSQGRGAGGGGVYYYPPCHMLQLCGFRVLLECPLDLSALAVFSPVPTAASSSPATASSGLIGAQPWYKTVPGLHLWDPSLIDAVLVSTPTGMLGLPFLTRTPNFKAKIYATEVTARIGRLWMQELVSMHREFEQFYGPDALPGFPHWMRWGELEKLPLDLKQLIMGEDGEELGSWMPLYSAADIKECITKVHTLKYGEETCFDGTIVFKAYSSGLEIGSCNWKIDGPKRSVTYLSSSIFESACAMGFDYRSLQGNDIIFFSDLSSISSFDNEAYEGNDCSIHEDINDSTCNVSDIRTEIDDKILEKICGSDESSEEIDKINFICSCVVDSLQEGGSILIPTGRLGTLLFLMEQISQCLETSNLMVPIFMVSDMAEEILTFINAVPEWLSKQRQEKLFSGEALFGHSELMKAKKLFAFQTISSSNLLKMWEEPCIVFSPHWSLRLGPVVHLLRRWHANPKCLLVLEQEVDAEMALLPFKPVTMKVLQCTFLSGLRRKKVQPLLELLQPKLILFPEDMRSQCPIKETTSKPLIYYSKNVKLRVPCLKDFNAVLARDLAVRLQPKRLTESMAVARLKGKFSLNRRKYFIVGAGNSVSTSNRQLFHWGSPDPARLLLALQEREFVGSLHMNEDASDGVHSINVVKPRDALIKTSVRQTTIICEDEETAALIYEALSSVLDRI